MLVHESPHCLAVGAELDSDLGQRPRPRDGPVGQIHPEVGEAELGRPSGEPLVGGVAALAGQPLSAWWHRDPVTGEGLLDRPVPTPSSAVSCGMLRPASLRACR